MVHAQCRDRLAWVADIQCVLRAMLTHGGQEDGRMSLGMPSDLCSPVEKPSYQQTTRTSPTTHFADKKPDIERHTTHTIPKNEKSQKHTTTRPDASMYPVLVRITHAKDGVKQNKFIRDGPCEKGLKGLVNEGRHQKVSTGHAPPPENAVDHMHCNLQARQETATTTNTPYHHNLFSTNGRKIDINSLSVCDRRRHRAVA